MTSSVSISCFYCALAPRYLFYYHMRFCHALHYYS